MNLKPGEFDVGTRPEPIKRGDKQSAAGFASGLSGQDLSDLRAVAAGEPTSADQARAVWNANNQGSQLAGTSAESATPGKLQRLRNWISGK